ncbi:MAG: hypothetical protein H7246_08565, partial [Phycisphaerae bacterium]|nr:hypothetical protein [Saprospiraceae bacterium]
MKKITTLLIATCIISSAIAQNLLPCPNGVVFVDNCSSACIPCDFQNPFNINSGSFSNDMPLEDCLGMHNNMWFAFQAFESTVSFFATSSNCDYPTNGIQMAVYGGCDGPCLFSDYGCTGNPVAVTATGLEIGTVYYVIVDGCFGAICDIEFTVDPISAIHEPEINNSDPVQGPSDVCSHGTFLYCLEEYAGATTYEWTVPYGVRVNGIPGPKVTLPAPEGHCAEISIGSNTGPIKICARPLSRCRKGNLQCMTANAVAVLETFLLPETVCQQDAVDYTLPWGDHIIRFPGTWDYQHTFVSDNGCDSIVYITLTIPPIVTTNLPPQYICPGECLHVGGMQFCTLGTYTVEMPSSMGCDSFIIFNLAQINLGAQINQLDTLNCYNSTVSLKSAPQPNGVKAWTNASGQVLGTGDTLAVSQPGMYFLSVTSNLNNASCTTIDSVEIKKDTLVPTVSLGLDTLDCASSHALIHVATDSIPVTYLWSGPGNFSDTVVNIDVTLAGQYGVTVTNLANGCTSSGLLQVPFFTPPDVTIDAADQIDCHHPLVSLNAHSVNAVTFAWTGPGGFVSQLQQPQVDTAGVYTVTVKDSSGCANSASITVSENLVSPVVSVAGDTLSCSQPTGVILASVQAGMATFAWSGPSGFTAVVPNPSVDLVGG